MFARVFSRVCAALLALCVSQGAVRSEDAPQDEAVAAAEFVVGNAMFVMFHEIGHMLISAFDIPVLGKEEDAVDNLATVIMLMAEDDVTAKALADSADAWFMFQERADASGYENDYSGVHSPDQARAYQIVCLMYGADPEAFKEVADAAELPEDRRQTCGEEYQQASNSWDKLLSEHIAEGDEVKTKIEVIIDEPPANMPAAELLKASEIVPEMANFVAMSFKLPFPLTFVLTSCGEPNAFWNPEKRAVVYCYELGQAHLDLWNQPEAPQ